MAEITSTVAQASKALDSFISSYFHDNSSLKIFLLTDKKVAGLWLNEFQKNSEFLQKAIAIVIDSGESSKSLATAEYIWNNLVEGEATRNSLLITLGGGMVSDIGGFCAACFKRGMPYVNISTTLLGAVDAASGGKTAINFAGLKNEIGAFHNPLETFIAVDTFETLPKREFLSGFAEIIKMAYLFNPDILPTLLECDPLKLNFYDLETLLRFCINKKNEITQKDFRDNGLRKLLNFGHTAGHAFESLSQKREQPIPHGECVAYGILFAMVLSNLLLDYPSTNFYPYINFLRANYNYLPFYCPDTDELINLVKHDKKNGAFSNPIFILLDKKGTPAIYSFKNDYALIEKAFEIFNEIR